MTNDILDKIYLENFGNVRLVLDLDTIEEYNKVRNIILDNQVIVEKLQKWKREEDEAISMFEGTNLQQQEFSVHKFRKTLSKYLDEILNLTNHSGDNTK